MSKTRKKKDSPFSKNLKGLLEERNINQKQAAILAEISNSVLSDWLCNTGSPQDLTSVAKLAKSLNVDFQWLLTGIKSSTSSIDNASLGDIFNIEDESMFTGIFRIEAKRLTRKKINNPKEGEK